MNCYVQIETMHVVSNTEDNNYDEGMSGKCMHYIDYI